jgi:hypothetical protein
MPASSDETEIYRGKTLGIGRVDRMYVVSHAQVAPSAEDWKKVCDLISSHYDDARGLFILTAWPSPNAAQRKAALAMLPKNPKVPPIAIMSEALIVRGVATALNWFLNDSVRAFQPHDVEGLAKHLKITEKDAANLIAFGEKLV